MSNTVFIMGANLAWKKEDEYAVDGMGTYPTLQEAAVARSKLHPSHPSEIYEVNPAITARVRRSFGLLCDLETTGMRVIKRHGPYHQYLS